MKNQTDQRHSIESDIQIVRDRLRAYGSKKVFLFGSGARGNLREGSDLDFLVIKDTSEPFSRRSRDLVLQYFADSPCRTPVDFIVYTPAEFEQAKAERRIFIEQVLRDGKLIYETT